MVVALNVVHLFPARRGISVIMCVLPCFIQSQVPEEEVQELHVFKTGCEVLGAGLLEE